ncbi:aldo/keto reductase [Actinoplanes sp. URMC 104]|uniref:aldo/keto reductase n=1 Tax=Actinoplanes sp. URMC 104 TaxID=3423409 RepID=UPI003F19385F
MQNILALDLPRDADMPRLCAERGIAFVPFFAIAGAGREDGPRAATGTAVHRVAEAHGVSVHQVRLAWTLHQGANVLAIPDTGDVRHLEDNIAAGGLRLTGEELAALSAG